MNNKRIISLGIILFCIVVCSSVAAYYYAAERNIKDNKMETYKFDATRMVNKVLDSTDISYLHGRFDKDGRFAIYRNDFIKKYNVQITNKRYYLSDDCDSLEHSIEKRIGKCWFLEFIKIDSISEDIYRLHYAVPYKSKGGFYDFNINDYAIVDSFMVEYKAAYDTVRYVIWNNVERFRKKITNIIYRNTFITPAIGVLTLRLYLVPSFIFLHFPFRKVSDGRGVSCMEFT